MIPEVKRMIDSEVEKRFMQNFETWKGDPSQSFIDVVGKNLKFTEEDEQEEADRKFKERQKKRFEMLSQRDEKRKAEKDDEPAEDKKKAKKATKK